MYIAFEGAEGCGKSTQSRRLADAIGAVHTRETGGTPIGQRLREILHDTSVTDLDDRAEALIVAADRAQHIADVVRPAIDSGHHVVSDRSVYSSLAYQGYGRGLPLHELKELNRWAISDLWPDLVILLSVPPEVGRDRMLRRELDRFERAGDEFHLRVDAAFTEMAAGDPTRWVTVDASGPLEAVAGQIRDAVRERLGV